MSIIEADPISEVKPLTCIDLNTLWMAFEYVLNYMILKLLRRMLNFFFTNLTDKTISESTIRRTLRLYCKFISEFESSSSRWKALINPASENPDISRCLKYDPIPSVSAYVPTITSTFLVPSPKLKKSLLCLLNMTGFYSISKNQSIRLDV
jgi:hypothetical protein